MFLIEVLTSNDSSLISGNDNFIVYLLYFTFCKGIVRYRT
jgi:hypothetical protein